MSPVPSNNRQPQTWNLPERLPAGFEATKPARGRRLTATCEAWTNPSGCELRLMIDGVPLMATVVPSAAEMHALAETWRAALLEKGWR